MLPRISLELRETIVQLHTEGYSGPDIIMQLNNKVSLSAVNRLIKKYKQTHSVRDSTKRKPEKVSGAVKTILRDTYEKRETW